MFYAMCPGPFFFSAEELLELLWLAASWCAPFVLAVLVFVKWTAARREREAQRYSLGLNDV